MSDPAQLPTSGGSSWLCPGNQELGLSNLEKCVGPREAPRGAHTDSLQKGPCLPSG